MMRRMMMMGNEARFNSNKEGASHLRKTVRSRSSELLNETKHDESHEVAFEQREPFLTQRLKSNQNVFDLKSNYENLTNRQRIKQLSLSHSNLLYNDIESKAAKTQNETVQRDNETNGNDSITESFTNQTNKKDHLVDSVFLARSRLSSSTSSSSTSSSSLSSLSSMPLSQTSSSNSYSNSNVSLLKQQQQQQQISTHKNNNKDKPALNKMLMSNKKAYNNKNKDFLSHFQTTSTTNEDKVTSTTTKMNELDEIKTGVVRDLCKKFCSIEENPVRQQHSSNLFFYYHFSPPQSAHPQQTSSSTATLNQNTTTPQTKPSNENNLSITVNKKLNKPNELKLDREKKMALHVDQSLELQKQSELSKSSNCLNESTSSSCSIDSSSMSNSTATSIANQPESVNKNKLADSDLFENVRIKERIDRFAARQNSNDSSSQSSNASVVSIKPNSFKRRVSSAKILTFMNERKSSILLPSPSGNHERSDEKFGENLGEELFNNVYSNIERNDEFFIPNSDSPNSTLSVETNVTLKRPGSNLSNSNFATIKERSKSLSNLKLRQHLSDQNRQLSAESQQNILARADSFLFNSILFEKNYSKIKEAFSDLRKDSAMIENLLNDVRIKVKEASNFLVLNEEIPEESAHLDEQQQDEQQIQNQDSSLNSRPSSFNANLGPLNINQTALLRSNTNESQTTLIRHKF